MLYLVTALKDHHVIVSDILQHCLRQVSSRLLDGFLSREEISKKCKYIMLCLFLSRSVLGLATLSIRCRPFISPYRTNIGLYTANSAGSGEARLQYNVEIQ